MEKFGFTPYKYPDLLTVVLFFKLCMSQRYVRNKLERNWKNSVCIVLRILLICKFQHFTAAFTKKTKLSKAGIKLSV